MIVAVQVWSLHLEGCHSLKERRSVLQPLKAALRRECNASVAETGGQDLWQRAEISCAVVGSDRAVVEGTLRSADRLVASADGARVMDTVVNWL
ncbi:MAG TPA: DUF503 domain-containing protein [Gemmatimonadales bacterium]|nr:DUF503 domain-containing protein [Gemmatimonadales bacterium]